MEESKSYHTLFGFQTKWGQNILVFKASPLRIYEPTFWVRTLCDALSDSPRQSLKSVKCLLNGFLHSWNLVVQIIFLISGNRNMPGDPGHVIKNRWVFNIQMNSSKLSTAEGSSADKMKGVGGSQFTFSGSVFCRRSADVQFVKNSCILEQN